MALPTAMISQVMHTNELRLVETQIGSMKHLKGTRLGSNPFEIALCFKSPYIVCADIVESCNLSVSFVEYFNNI